MRRVWRAATGRREGAIAHPFGSGPEARERPVGRALLGLVLALACAGDLAAVEGGFRHRRHGYTLSVPGGAGRPWERVEIEGAVIAFRRPGPETISVQSSCGRTVSDPAILARHLVIGVDRQALEQAGPTLVDGHNAWTQTFDTAEGVRIKTVTAVAGDCVIDWILAARGGEDFAAAEADFDAWWSASRLPVEADASEGGG
jgi:hypothetical protein